MQRICPFLAADDEGLTVVDGFDPQHRCRAVRPIRGVGRTQQVGTCLEASHTACERYLAAVSERESAAWPLPAADATFVQTRLVLDPSRVARLATDRTFTFAGRRWIVGGALAVAGVAAVSAGIAGSLGIASRGSEPSPTPATAATASPTQQPAIGGLSSAPAATPQPTALPTPLATTTPAATATPQPTAQPTAEQQTYVVQAGDTLNDIAIRFGTTVRALQEANGLGDSDIIRVGQVLIIP